jgi:Glycosyl hydrolase family 57
MNAPFLARDAQAATATLSLFSLFHLNLAFSSIEEEQRGEVIARCYWPLLRLAETHGPIGIEATGFTLEEIAERDPSWIAKARVLIAAGKVELIGSGYAQVIAPLVPARVTEENLRIGNEIYEHLLGVRPHLALVNEQAYSGGLVGLYLDAGYRALLMDWDNPSAHHPEWPRAARYQAQRALGSDGRSIALLWTNTVAFQKLQRLAHGDIELGDYLSYLRSQRGAEPRTLCFYAGDGEIFDFRPGRYRTEEKLSGESEWLKLEQAYAAIVDEPGFELVAPSAALVAVKRQPLRLESAACPIPVKKQRKYNLSRWAVTGRDDVAVNAACQRVHDGMIGAPDADWKELCTLWSSDFRTHITEKRWSAFRARLEAAEQRWSKPPLAIVMPKGELVAARHIDVRTPSLTVRLDRRRGLALSQLAFTQHAMSTLGGLPHGYFDDIHVQADWYTGDCVFEAPGEHKITDLENCETRVWTDGDDTFAFARIETPKGPIEKTMRFLGNEPRVEFDVTFHWEDWGRGSLRLGHFTLLPDAFDWATLSLTTHNGGKTSETFALAGHDVDHGAPVSFLVSASHGLGMTEGWAEIGDDKTRLRIEIDRATAPLLGFLTHRRIGGSLFCQFALSALELDDTRKPSPYRGGPRRFRFSVNRALP